MALISLYGRLDEGQGASCQSNKWRSNEMQIENLRLVDIIVRLHVRNKARKLRVELLPRKPESLRLNKFDGVWLKQRLIRKLFLKLISIRNQTTPQARLKCLYGHDVVASPANLATYHNDHCIHRPGYEATNQARLKALSGERMSRRNELIEGRRQWLHQTLDRLSPEEKASDRVDESRKTERKDSTSVRADSVSMRDNGSMVLREFERGYASMQRVNGIPRPNLVRVCVLPRVPKEATCFHR